MKTTTKNMAHRVAAKATMVVMLSTSAVQQAQAMGIRDITNNLINTSGAFTDLIGTAAYIGGFGYTLAGLVKLKAHVDNPGNTPTKDYASRLTAGGALVSMPYIVTELQESVRNTSNATILNTSTQITAPPAP